MKNYKKPLQKKQKTDTPKTSKKFRELVTELERQKEFYDVPTSPATNGVLKVLSSGKDNLAKMNSKAKTVNHNQQIEVLQNGVKRLIKINSDNSTVEIELADIEKLTDRKSVV